LSQRALQQLGFMEAVDADFGAGTQVAMAALQRDRKIDVDGIVGNDTWTALAKALKDGKWRKPARRPPISPAPWPDSH
jgi:putative chitinase